MPTILRIEVTSVDLVADRGQVGRPLKRPRPALSRIEMGSVGPWRGPARPRHGSISVLSTTLMTSVDREADRGGFGRRQSRAERGRFGWPAMRLQSSICSALVEAGCGGRGRPSTGSRSIRLAPAVISVDPLADRGRFGRPLRFGQPLSGTRSTWLAPELAEVDPKADRVASDRVKRVGGLRPPVSNRPQFRSVGGSRVERLSSFEALGVNVQLLGARGRPGSHPGIDACERVLRVPDVRMVIRLGQCSGFGGFPDPRVGLQIWSDRSTSPANVPPSGALRRHWITGITHASNWRSRSARPWLGACGLFSFRCRSSGVSRWMLSGRMRWGARVGCAGSLRGQSCWVSHELAVSRPVGAAEDR
jgi:hypothetical protein